MPRSLPPQASITHLKKQAKSLLKEVRAGDPEALQRFVSRHPAYQGKSTPFEGVTLQQVQLAVAREYGFASWPMLIQRLAAPQPESAAPQASVAADSLLVYTNGSNAIDILDKAGIGGEKVEWLEALNEGPVPLTASDEELYRLRAAHMAELGWTSVEGALQRFEKRDAPLSRPSDFSELQLWFEHDLFDQLQLIQLLDRLRRLPDWQGKVALLQFDTFIGYLKPEEVAERMPPTIPIEDAHLKLAQSAWHAFRQPDSRQIAELLRGDTQPLPFLRPAFARLLEELPHERSGTGRTERQILEDLSQGKDSPGSLFRFSQSQEEAAFMGDASFFVVVQRLSQGERPLISTANGQPFQTPTQVGYTEAFRSQRLSITRQGEEVLSHKANWLRHLPRPYWVGGQRIEPIR